MIIISQQEPSLKLVEKLEKRGRREEYEGVLIEEYSQLDAIEKEPEPGSKGTTCLIMLL